MVDAVRYRQYPVGAPLDSRVECVWMLSQPAAVSDVQRIPPDGCIELIFHLGQPLDERAGSRWHRQPASLIVGVWTRPIELMTSSASETVGIRFRPGGAAAFLHERAALFTDVSVDATAILGASGARLLEQLASCGDSDAARVAVVRAFLLARLRPRDAAIRSSIGRIVAAGGRVPIERIARDNGMSTRRLERAFDAHVGVPPKTLSRILRFQNVLRRQTPRTAIDWADTALACGYVDQSHLIRDFAQFAGETPAQLAAAHGTLAEFFRTPARLRELFRASALLGPAD